MPYRRRGRAVEVKEDGWRVFKLHPTVAKAGAHLRALRAAYYGIASKLKRSRRGSRAAC